MDYLQRQKRMAASLEASGLDGYLVTHMANVRYLSGFTGSAGVLAVATTSGRAKYVLFTDGRYTQQAKEQVPGAKVVIAKRSVLLEAASWLRAQRAKRVGFEAAHMPVATREILGKELRGRPVLRSTREVVEKLRMIKEPAEIEQIRKAVNLGSSVLEAVLPDVKPGVPENSIAAEIEYMCRRLGAEGMSFETLIASGKRSALPHGIASRNPLPAKGFVIIDFGVILGGYCSDMTRTVHLGHPDRSARAMYAAVKEAQLAGIEAVKPGAQTWEVDSAARKVLVKAGLGRYFSHSTGHGVGIEIHEPPGLRKAPGKSSKGRKSKSPESDTLEPGMVVTIEPGVYIPGKGGVRIEDMVLVTKSGCEILTPNPKEIIIIE